MFDSQILRISEAAWNSTMTLYWIWFTIGLLLGVVRSKQLCDSGVFFIMMGRPPLGMSLFFQRLAQMVSILIYIGLYLILWPLDIGSDSGNNFKH